MSYCTLDDIKQGLDEARIEELTDDEGQGTIDLVRVQMAIETADAEIDGYCAKYDLPFTPTPTLVKKLSVDIAIYNLYSRRPEKMPEMRQVRYDNAIRMLVDVAKGLVDPVGPTDQTAGDLGLAENSKTASDRIFTRDTLANY